MTPSNTPALEGLEIAVQNERDTKKLMEVAFYPGSDAEVSHEEAAKAGLDMYGHYQAGRYSDVTNRPL